MAAMKANSSGRIQVFVLLIAGVTLGQCAMLRTSIKLSDAELKKLTSNDTLLETTTEFPGSSSARTPTLDRHPGTGDDNTRHAADPRGSAGSEGSRIVGGSGSSPHEDIGQRHVGSTSGSHGVKAGGHHGNQDVRRPQVGNSSPSSHGVRPDGHHGNQDVRRPQIGNSSSSSQGVRPSGHHGNQDVRRAQVGSSPAGNEGISRPHHRDNHGQPGGPRTHGGRAASAQEDRISADEKQ